ncbi:unnamed protein product, partial [Nesidiocoris tenuis]
MEQVVLLITDIWKNPGEFRTASLYIFQKRLREGGGALEKGFTCTWRLWLLPIVVTATPPATELAAQRSRKEPEPWGRSAHFLRQEVKEVASLEYHRCSPSSQVQGGTRQLAFCQAMADNTVVPKGAELRLVEWRGSQPIVSRRHTSKTPLQLYKLFSQSDLLVTRAVWDVCPVADEKAEEQM